MHHTWTCHCCGKQFDELPHAVAIDVPDPWLNLSDAEQKTRGQISQDTCFIDDDQFFVRGCLEVPILGRRDVFTFSVWVSLSRQNFLRIQELWDVELTEHEPPMFGWLSNNIWSYPETFCLKTQLHLRNGGIRPFIELEPTEHPLAREQREGITLGRVEEIFASTQAH